MTAVAHELRAWVAPTRVVLHKHDDFNDDLTLKDGHATRRLTRLVRELVEFATRRLKAVG